MIRKTLLQFTLIVLLLPFGLSASGNDSPKLILIHMDAVSSKALMEELHKGNMPNIERIFYDKGLKEKAITYFPSKTPFVISSIRDAKPITEGDVVGWEIPDYNDEQSLKIADSFLLMAFSKMRLARANLIYGLPVLNRLADIALMNSIDYFDDYKVLEFYWYEIDTYGHFKGQEEYLERLRQFDRRLGRFIDKLDDDINVVIYADHGMVFGEGIRIEDDMKNIFGDRLKAFSYPTVYLTDPDEREIIAKEITEKTELDFAFFIHNENSVKGFSNGNTLFFDFKDGTFRYRYEGNDPFKYFENGYDGEFMSADEWLRFSADLEYPVTPVVVYWSLQNPNTGEIVTSFNDEKYAETGYSRSGNHGGFTGTELVVPVLVKGPNVEYIGDFELLWLQELFNEIGDFEFRQTPRRDSHFISSRYLTRNKSTRTEIAISPYYRYRFATEIDFGSYDSARFGRLWGQFDLYRSYIARLWFGAGVDFYGPDTIGMLLIKHEFHVQKFSVRTLVSTAGNHRFTLGYSINKNFAVEVTNFTQVGFRLSI